VCVAGRTDDVDSHVEGVLRLISDREYYEGLRRACPEVAEPFYDRERGLAAVLRRIIEPLKDGELRPGEPLSVRQEEPVDPSAREPLLDRRRAIARESPTSTGPHPLPSQG
jgi:hypothetical protein